MDIIEGVMGLHIPVCMWLCFGGHAYYLFYAVGIPSPMYHSPLSDYFQQCFFVQLQPLLGDSFPSLLINWGTAWHQRLLTTLEARTLRIYMFPGLLLGWANHLISLVPNFLVCKKVGLGMYLAGLLEICLIRSSLCSLVAQMVKRLSTMRETWVRSLGQEDSLEKEMASHSSTLA